MAFDGKTNADLIEMRERYLMNGPRAKAEEIRKELDRRRSIKTATFKRNPKQAKLPKWI